MRYRYEAIGPGGLATAGEVEAAGRVMAMGKLRALGLVVTSLHPVLQFRLNWNLDLGAPKLSLRQLAELFNLLAMLLDGGLPVLQALQVLGGTMRPPASQILAAMAAEVAAGEPLSRAMAAQRSVFPRLAVHIVGVSELAGELPAGLRQLANQFDAEDQIQRKFKSAMIYPVVVLVMALGLAVFMTVFIVPSFAGMFKDLKAQLPWQTRALLAVSNFIQQEWYLLATAVAGAVFGYRQALQKSERFRLLVARTLLRVPVFGPLIWLRETAHYTRTLGTMLQSGVPVMVAVQAAVDLVQNAHMANRLTAVPADIAGGASLGQALKRSQALPPLMVELLIVGEVIGRTDETLHRVAGLTDGQVKQTLERLTALLEPFMILILGSIVLMVVVPLLLPMFDLYTKIK